jgi:cytochrome c biogenesis protein
MAEARAAAPSWPYNDPVRWLWRGLTSVRFALGLIGFLALAALLGVLIPQLPAEMRGNPAAEAAWFDFQERRFGFLTDPMQRLGLFELFRSLWFVSGLGILVISVCVCTVNRFGPIWRNVAHPQTRVADEYFGRGQPVVEVAASDVASLDQELRRRRYRVSTSVEGGATYLFADRYPWAQLATFVSHLALILFLAGGLVTVVTARQQQVFVAEGEAGAPIFAPSDRDHMQVYVEDAIGRFDASGFPLDFRTQLVVYQGGKEVARGVSTVNDPLAYGGYKFHQSAYFPDGAALQVREVQTGRVVYDEVLALTSSAATPRLVVRDGAGAVLLDDVIVPTDFFAGVAGTLITIPGQARELWVGARPRSDEQGWQLVVLDTANPDSVRAILAEGEQTRLGDFSFSFPGVTAIPSTVVTGLPGTEAPGVAELSRGPAGPLLTVGPVEERALALSPGQPVQVGGYEYTFVGQREFAGLTVRRDHGATFIWLATGLFLAGLALTFYTPRRRLWGKIAAGQAAFRGLGGRASAIEREIKEAAAAAATPAALEIRRS